MNFDISNVWSKLLDMAVEYGPKLVGAIFIAIIGMYIIKLIDKLLGKMLARNNNDQSLTTFLKSLVNIALKTLLVVSVLSMIGIEMTSFIANGR